MTRPKRSRNAVSFTKFRQMHLTALRYLVNRFSLNNTVSVDVRLVGYAILVALSEARFADAVELSGKLQSQQYDEAEAHRLGYQIAFLVKKVPFQDASLDPEFVARKKFWEAEEHCRATNAVLRPVYAFMNGIGNYKLDEGAQRQFQLIMRARKYIRRVIGEKPDLQALYKLARFSSGSAQGATGNATHFLRKMGADQWSVTPSALTHALEAARLLPTFHEGLNPFDQHSLVGVPFLLSEKVFNTEFRSRCRYVEHDIINYVLKTADCHRTVGSPPLLNIFVQNGVGDWIRERLRDRAHIDITTAQEEVNGKLAYLGSSCEGMPFSTIDLKAASDTISIMFVKLLLPELWFEFLDQIRCPGFTLEGESHRSNKFMAMGNGFCFPLETLLFWSLIQAVYEDNDVPDARCAVYGDDIIVYQSAALELIELLDSVGFDVNTDKTFIFGPFRESCGQDFFNGVNVRPFVCDFTITNYGQAFHFINSLRSKGFTNLASTLISEFIPPDWAFFRPDLAGGPSNTALDVSYPQYLDSPSKYWNTDLQCWEWNELLSYPVMDCNTYGSFRRYEMGGALQGAEPSKVGKPSFSLRRETRTDVRRVAHG